MVGSLVVTLNQASLLSIVSTNQTPDWPGRVCSGKLHGGSGSSQAPEKGEEEGFGAHQSEGRLRVVVTMSASVTCTLHSYICA